MACWLCACDYKIEELCKAHKQCVRRYAKFGQDQCANIGQRITQKEILNYGDIKSLPAEELLKIKKFEY